MLKIGFWVDIYVRWTTAFFLYIGESRDFEFQRVSKIVAFLSESQMDLKLTHSEILWKGKHLSCVIVRFGSLLAFRDKAGRSQVPGSLEGQA